MNAVGLTDRGERRVESAAASSHLADTPKGAILVLLYEEGPLMPDDIADRLGTSVKKTMSFLRALEREEYVAWED